MERDKTNGLGLYSSTSNLFSLSRAEAKDRRKVIAEKVTVKIIFSEIEHEFNEESLNLSLFNVLKREVYCQIALLDDFYGRCLWLKEKSSQSELEQKLAVAKNKFASFFILRESSKPKVCIKPPPSRNETRRDRSGTQLSSRKSLSELEYIA